MQVSIHAEDWMLTMGLVGLQRVLGDRVTVTDFGLTFDTNVLKSLPGLFFEYMIAEHNIAERDHKRMKDSLRFAKRDKDSFARNLKDIKKLISDQSKKVKRYFSGTPEMRLLEEVGEGLKSIKELSQIDELRAQVESFKSIMETKEINDKLTTNFFKATVMTSFFGQPSFLNVSKNSLSVQEQMDLFYKDYVEPVLIEHHLQELLASESPVDECFSFLEEHQDYEPCKRLKRLLRNKSSWVEIKVAVEALPKCSFLDNQIATGNYEEMVFSPLGVSRGNAVNFIWDLQGNQPVPLSALAKLVLFMAPAGTVSYYRKDGFEEQGEYRPYVGFVMSDDAFPEILQMNDHFRSMKRNNNPFDEIVHGLSQDTQQRAKFRARQLLFIELHAEYQSKRTLLDYYHMPYYMARYFSNYGDKLKAIGIREYREAFTRSALRGIEPKEELFAYARAVIRGNLPGVGLYVAARELNRIQALKKGVIGVNKTDKRVGYIFSQGKLIRKKMLRKSTGRAQVAGETYRASGSKKINAVTYRLLNASKAENRKSFMDTVLRLYMTAEEPVPAIFLNSLHERDLRFEVIACAFIAGLLSSESENEEEILGEKSIVTNGSV